MTKTIFSAESQLTPSWFNTIQNLRFRDNPENDGEYDLINPEDIQSGVIEGRYLGNQGGSVSAKKTLFSSPEIVEGNFATLGGLTRALDSTVTNFSSDGTLRLVQGGSSLLVEENVLDNIIELGDGNVIVRGFSAVPGGGLFLTTVSFPINFRETPFLLSANPNFLGRLNHIVDLNTSTFSAVMVRVGAAKITDELRYLAVGRVG